MSKVVQDVKRFLWLHPQVVDPATDPVELMRDLLEEHEKLLESLGLKKKDAAA
jgi:hypothetical protein